MKEIGLLLSVRGSELKKRRNQACHWPGSRAVSKPDNKIHFTNPENVLEPGPTFDTESLLSISREIMEWCSMVGMYGVIVCLAYLKLEESSYSGAPPLMFLPHLFAYKHRYDQNFQPK